MPLRFVEPAAEAYLFPLLVGQLLNSCLLASKQEGISFILVDMRTPGVEVRPIVTLDGEHEVNEVFFTAVRA